MTRPAQGDILTTRTGFRFRVRPATFKDDAAIRVFFSHVTRADLRFRFLVSMEEVGSSEIEMLTHPDHEYAESFLAFVEDGSMMIASGVLACDKSLERGEVAIAIREDHKRKGIGWDLLAYIARFAETKGVKRLESIESRDNHEAIELERDMGFVASEYPGDSALVMISRSLDQRIAPPSAGKLVA